MPIPQHTQIFNMILSTKNFTTYQVVKNQNNEKGFP